MRDILEENWNRWQLMTKKRKNNEISSMRTLVTTLTFDAFPWSDIQKNNMNVPKGEKKHFYPFLQVFSLQRKTFLRQKTCFFRKVFKIANTFWTATKSFIFYAFVLLQLAVQHHKKWIGKLFCRIWKYSKTCVNWVRKREAQRLWFCIIQEKRVSSRSCETFGTTCFFWRKYSEIAC